MAPSSILPYSKLRKLLFSEMPVCDLWEDFSVYLLRREYKSYRFCLIWRPEPPLLSPDIPWFLDWSFMVRGGGEKNFLGLF